MPSIKLLFTKIYISRFGKVFFNIWVWAGLFLALVFLSFAGIKVTGQSFFCGTCHEMREHFSTWRISSHKDVKCVECHIPSGVMNMISKKMSV